MSQRQVPLFWLHMKYHIWFDPTIKKIHLSIFFREKTATSTVHFYARDPAVPPAEWNAEMKTKKPQTLTLPSCKNVTLSIQNSKRTKSAWTSNKNLSAHVRQRRFRDSCMSARGHRPWHVGQRGAQMYE